MVAILSTPKPLPPASSIPRRPPSQYDHEAVYRTTVEPSLHIEKKLARHFSCTAILLYTLLVVVGATALVYHSVNSATIDIRIPRPTHNQSLSIVHHRVMGKLRDSTLRFVQISFYAMARFQHPGNDVNVESITVSVYNGATRVGGGQYREGETGEYPVIHDERGTTEIALRPKATLLEGEQGFAECTSKHAAHIPLRLFYSILVSKKTMFGGEIKGRIEYSQTYSVCCSCQMHHEFLRRV